MTPMTRRRRSRARSFVGRCIHLFAVVLGAVALTALCFLILPLIQAINAPPRDLLAVTSIQTVDIPPPPPPPEEEEEKEEEEEPEEKPPELQEEIPPLDLEALESLLNPGVGGDGLTGQFEVRLNTVSEAAEEAASSFDSSDVDQAPRAIHQPSPVLDREARERAPGTVYVIFIVGPDGKVEEPRVQRSSDPIFEKPTLAAVRQWRFEPGKRAGQPVRVRMRVPITFPKD